MSLEGKSIQEKSIEEMQQLNIELTVALYNLKSSPAKEQRTAWRLKAYETVQRLVALEKFI